MTATFSTRLALQLHARGKVRDTYSLPDGELLMVATDRLSAFDVVLPTPIPDKGRVLTQLSLYWFGQTRALVENHLCAEQRIQPELLAEQADLAARCMRVRRVDPIPYECVVRGYLAGSGWKEYREGGTIGGDPLPRGLRESERLPEPIFTPAVKAQTGHDENISRAELSARAGVELATELERVSLALYRHGADHAESRGLILADTKFEFGRLDGRLILIDELLTPDSSRFWDGERYQLGTTPPSFDKQYVRDYLERIGWNKQPPGPSLPEEVVAGTRSRYLEAWHRLAGQLVPG